MQTSSSTALYSSMGGLLTTEIKKKSYQMALQYRTIKIALRTQTYTIQ